MCDAETIPTVICVILTFARMNESSNLTLPVFQDDTSLCNSLEAVSVLSSL